MPRGRRPRTVVHDDEPTPIRRRATSPEVREQQLIAAAYDLAERRIREGTASAQEVTTFLKLGSSRERLEQERLSRENVLLEAKAEMIASQKRVEELYGAALNAMRSYAGQPPIDIDPETGEIDLYGD